MVFSEGSVRRTAERAQPLRGDLPALVQAERGERGERADAGQPRVGHLVAALQVQVAQARQRAQRAQLVACGQKPRIMFSGFRGALPKTSLISRHLS